MQQYFSSQILIRTIALVFYHNNLANIYMMHKTGNTGTVSTPGSGLCIILSKAVIAWKDDTQSLFPLVSGEKICKCLPLFLMRGSSSSTWWKPIFLPLLFFHAMKSQLLCYHSVAHTQTPIYLFGWYKHGLINDSSEYQNHKKWLFCLISLKCGWMMLIFVRMAVKWELIWWVPGKSSVQVKINFSGFFRRKNVNLDWLGLHPESRFSLPVYGQPHIYQRFRLVSLTNFWETPSRFWISRIWPLHHLFILLITALRHFVFI